MKNHFLDRLLRYSYLIIFILISLSCSKDEDDNAAGNVASGEFKLNISGSENRSLNGGAAFFHVVITQGGTGSQGATLSISLTGNDDNDAFAISMIKILPEGYSTGTYTTSEDSSSDNEVISSSFYSKSLETTFLAETTTVILTRVSNTVVEGSVSAQMTNFDGKTITVAGSFNAIGFTSRY